ncbi:Peroxidase [Rhynchospora pubera]|uniref:Peroxidase n=1 Tax=Rhynchospora pubera TaxID=906938 RepID=A0AAV8GLS5_9POAL|nr:Peroxidase [Rhynchospora pubera]
MANNFAKRSFLVILQISLLAHLGSAQLSSTYYANTCPTVETIVKDAVTAKFQETFNAVGGVVRLLFHDCFVQGCDGSVLISSTPTNKAERDNDLNLSLNSDGFDAIVRAKSAVESVCPNLVSCADILVMATRDMIELAGGPSYSVELGRFDGLVSSSDNVDNKLPLPTFNLDQLTALFASNNISQEDMIALSACHTIGLGHCNKFKSRLYGSTNDSSLNPSYAAYLAEKCPENSTSDDHVFLDPVTPGTFDKQYFQNLIDGVGLFSSDEVLYTDNRSQPLVNLWANSDASFQQAFVSAITNLARVGVKTSLSGNIRKDCLAFN